MITLAQIHITKICFTPELFESANKVNKYMKGKWLNKLLCSSSKELSRVNQVGTSLMVQQLKLHVPIHEGGGSTPGQTAKIPHTLWPKIKTQNIKYRQYCNKLHKDFKNRSPSETNKQTNKQKQVYYGGKSDSKYDLQSIEKIYTLHTNISGNRHNKM